MTRLTYKTDKGDYTGMPNSISIEEALEKLARLEDAEELCERIKAQPIYIKKYDRIIERNFTDRHILYDFDEKCIRIRKYDCIYKLFIKDYGITWALTKEELEK